MSAPIIITVPNNYLAMEEIESKVMVDVASPSPSRKRRLDHLTWEEKMQRKKLKNRVAAQTSRDRKKAKMDEMENRIKHFMEVNEKLINEVESLKALNERLLSENAKLRSEAAARTVAGAPGPAEGRAPAGDASGTPTVGDVPLTDILAHLDSEEYLDTLQQLANSLLQEIDASAAAAVKDVTIREARECIEGAQVVGTTTKQLESSKDGSIDTNTGYKSDVDIKHDVDRIMSQHSYAHPHPDIIVTKPEETEQFKEDNWDKGDIFFTNVDDANDCITIEVPCEDQVVEEVIPVGTDMDFKSLTNNSSEITLECDMKLLSPMSLSPKSEENLLGLSPSHTILSSDLGYESLASPFSEPESIDLSDFWCESFSELFPGLT